MVLRGIGQVMFQGNALTGLLFLLGILAADVPMGLAALGGSVTGTLAAWLLGYDHDEIRDGIYGFNGTLVGIAALFFFQSSLLLLALLTVAAAASSVVTWAARRFVPFPTYTAPFIVVTWALIAVDHLIGIPEVNHPVPTESLNMATALMGVTEGLGEVMFQANVVTGIAFLIGLAVSDWRHAVLGMLGSILGTLVAIYHQDLPGSIEIGIYGYNATLTAIALYLWRKSLLIPILGALISTPITEYFGLTGLATLTAPFVAACWIVILVGAMEEWFNNQDHSPAAATETMADPAPSP